MGFKTLRAPDLTKLWHDVTRWQLFKDEVDLYLSIGTNLENVILEASNANYDFNLREVWLNPQRWTRLTREYLDGPETKAFVRRSRQILSNKGKNGVVTNMFFRSVTRRSTKHRWGNCLMAATFRGSDHGRSIRVQPTLTIHSRVSYNAYMLGLDIGLVHVLAREISEGQPERIRVQWHLDVMQLHSFKCLPYLYTQPDLMQILEDMRHGDETYGEKYPTWKSIERWWLNYVIGAMEAGKSVEEEKYGPLKRIRRRYEEYQNGIFVPSVHIGDLDLSKVEGYE